MRAYLLTHACIVTMYPTTTWFACCSANMLQMPSQQAGILVLQRLLAGCRLATCTLPAVHSAAAQLLAQLSMTYFMPFCLSALSMVARVQVRLCFLCACHRGKHSLPLIQQPSTCMVTSCTNQSSSMMMSSPDCGIPAQLSTLKKCAYKRFGHHCMSLVCVSQLSQHTACLSVLMRLYHCAQVLVCQLLMDSIKAYNCLLPLVTALPRQVLPLPASKSLAGCW